MSTLRPSIKACSAFAVSTMAYKCADEGIANILAIKTLKHGTNFCDGIRIRLTGGDPAHGAKATGSTVKKLSYMQDNCKGYFFLFNEKLEIIREINPTVYHGTNPFKVNLFLFLFPLPYLHSYFSSTHYMDAKNIQNTPVRIVYHALSLGICPIRFRFAEIDPSRMERDEDYDHSLHIAYKTRLLVEPWRIGLMGSILTGLNTGWIERAKQDPTRVCLGLAQVSGACLLVMSRRFLLKRHPITSLIGAICG